MKSNKYFAIVATIVLAAGISVAQTPKKYQKTVETNSSPTCCPHMHSSMEDMHSKSTDRGANVNNTQTPEGDPSAPQDHIEYGG